MQPLKKSYPSLIGPFDNIFKCILVATARFIDFSAPVFDGQAYRLLLGAINIFSQRLGAKQIVNSEIIQAFVKSIYQEVKKIDLEKLFKITANVIEWLTKDFKSEARSFLIFYQHLQLYIENFKTPKKNQIIQDLDQRAERVSEAIVFFRFFCVELRLEMDDRIAAAFKEKCH